jgi:NAD-dependent deacetylase
MSQDLAQVLGEAAEALARARRVLVITGAGISADSGLPTYRGIGGLYESADTADGVPIEEALSGRMMATRPELCWRYIHQIESSCRGARPNAAHEALARMENGFQRFTVLTQNIDGFHRDAGSRDLIEIHGNLRELYCTACGAGRCVSSFAGLAIPPRCEECHGLLRPRVVLFGEMLPTAALDRLYAAVDEGLDAVISIGTTSVFPYIAGPMVTAARLGLPTVEINPGESEISSLVRYRIRERAALAVPRLRTEIDRRRT